MNDENLIPVTARTKSEARQISINGGKRSGEVRRQRKEQREQLEMLLSLPLKSIKAKQQLIDIGIKEEDANNQMAMNVAMLNLILKGGKGAVQAYNSFISQIDDKDKELKIKRQEAEIEKLKLECEKLRQETNTDSNTYEDLTPLAELLKGDK